MSNRIIMENGYDAMSVEEAVDADRYTHQLRSDNADWVIDKMYNIRLEQDAKDAIIEKEKQDKNLQLFKDNIQAHYWMADRMLRHKTAFTILCDASKK